MQCHCACRCFWLVQAEALPGGASHAPQSRLCVLLTEVDGLNARQLGLKHSRGTAHSNSSEWGAARCSPRHEPHTKQQRPQGPTGPACQRTIYLQVCSELRSYAWLCWRHRLLRPAAKAVAVHSTDRTVSATHLGMLQPVCHIVDEDDTPGSPVLGTVSSQDANCTAEPGQQYGGTTAQAQSQRTVKSLWRVASCRQNVPDYQPCQGNCEILST